MEYVLAPDPNVGPFQAIAPGELHTLLSAAGFTRSGARGSQATPQPDEIAFRTRNFSSRSQSLARGVSRVLGLLEKLPGINSDRGRFQFRTYTR